MNKNTLSLLVFLENQAVMKDGFLNQKELSIADRKNIEYWEKENMLEIIKLPLPKIKDDITYTHKFRLSESLFNLAQTTRKKYAQRLKPFLNSPEDRKSTLKIVQNGQVKPAPDKAAPPRPTYATKNIVEFTMFEQWMVQKNVQLSEEQHTLAKLMFVFLNDPAVRSLIKDKGAGQSFLFKCVDQYLTLIKNQSQNNHE